MGLFDKIKEALDADSTPQQSDAMIPDTPADSPLQQPATGNAAAQTEAHDPSESAAGAQVGASGQGTQAGSALGAAAPGRDDQAVPAVEQPAAVVEQPAAPAPQEAPAAAPETYTVAEGDNLTWIGERFGVSVDDLVAANGIDNPDLIFPGQVLTIPR